MLEKYCDATANLILHRVRSCGHAGLLICHGYYVSLKVRRELVNIKVIALINASTLLLPQNTSVHPLPFFDKSYHIIFSTLFQLLLRNLLCDS